MLVLTRQGLYCPAGRFHIDPSGAVENAVVTHAHSDHARRGAKHYYCARSGVGLLKTRLGAKIAVTGLPFGEKFEINGVTLSFHPAGHILGSAQVRLENGGEVWVASGDYKRDADPTCEPFESVPCDVFVTEATFGTPSYVWPKNVDLGREISDWWRANAAAGRNSVLFAYSLGKAQRVLGVLHPFAERPVICHPSVLALNESYLEQGVKLAPTADLTRVTSPRLRGELILTPSSFLETPAATMLGDDYVTAFASGWMAGGTRGYDHGFVMSDHADWNDLVRTVLESGAKRVYVQHRGKGALVKHLRSLGIQAFPESELALPETGQLSLF